MLPTADSTSRRRATAVVAAVIVLAAAMPLASHEDRLFASSGISNVVVRVPVAELVRGSGGPVTVDGSVAIDGGPAVDVSCETYGISRLRECELPSLHLTAEDGAAPATALAGHRSLRLVTPCRLRGDHDRHVVLEHLVYAAYATLTETALHTRLARVRFYDTARNDAQSTGYGFFIEDIDDVAARLGRSWDRTEPKALDQLDAAELTLMTLFQFMVGNTDWSAVRGHGTELCCHNVAVLWGEPAAPGLVLPFDFDQSGVVDAPYAVPAPEFGIRTVTQRVFRGFCEHNRYLDAAIARFNDARSDIEAVFASPDLPYPKDRRRALRYVAEFYEIVNDPTRLERQVASQCR